MFRSVRFITSCSLLFGLVHILQGRINHDNLPIILWWDGVGRQEADIVSCSEEFQCFSTENTSYLHTQDIMVYGFYGSRMFQTGLPVPRLKGDLWALIEEKSPSDNHYLYSFDNIAGLFNYSATFKRESDYPFPTHSLKGESQLMSKDFFTTLEEKNMYRKRGYAPVVFVHWECSTPSRREGFVNKLMGQIQVDSYGPCLHNKDYPESHAGLENLHTMDSDDLLVFLSRYKFVIAMENAICDDYISDNLWRPLEAGIVPILKGSPKIRDFLPAEKSALIIDDFKNAKDLAEFIEKLDQDDDAYEAYRKFKTEGISNPTLSAELKRRALEDDNQRNFMKVFRGFECFLCEKLHDAVAAVKDGKPIPKAKATIDHMSCPLPVHKYDEEGIHVEDKSVAAEYGYFKAHADNKWQFYNTINKMAMDHHMAEMDATKQEL